MRCGTDICDVNRMQESIEKLGDKFLKRVFTEKEIAYCEAKKMKKFESYAARFAGKEAVYKALASEKTSDGVFTEVEIQNADNGKPYVVLHGTLKELYQQENIEISLSHEKEYAIAMAIVYS